MLKRIWASKQNILRRSLWFIVRQIAIKTKIFAIAVVEQEAAFKSIGLDRSDGLMKLNEVLRQSFGKSYDETDGMFSEHLIMIASIAASGRDIGGILEIGTFDERTALILSRLFPNVRIATIDLGQDTGLFKDSYGRQNETKTFVTNRDKHLADAANVEFKEMNSIALVNEDENFDLIWIDGAHGYPTIAMDIINAYRISKDQCAVLIDDVFLSKTQSDSIYESVGAYESLASLVDAELIKSFKCFPKRLSSQFKIPGEKNMLGFS